jgi:hypothetical protein
MSGMCMDTRMYELAEDAGVLAVTAYETGEIQTWQLALRPPSTPTTTTTTTRPISRLKVHSQAGTDAHNPKRCVITD